VPDSFLTIQEVTELLRVDPQTVYNWLDRGELASVRVGKRRRRIRQADLDAFIAAGSQPASPPEGQEPAGNGSDSTDDADSPTVEATDGLEGLDRAEIVQALDAVSQAVQTLADRTR
jgi:excisionase family DNA binding protein